jgi:hypothetical protein
LKENWDLTKYPSNEDKIDKILTVFPRKGMGNNLKFGSRQYKLKVMRANQDEIINLKVYFDNN